MIVGRIVLEDESDVNEWESYSDEVKEDRLERAESISDEYYDGENISFMCLRTHLTFGFD